MPIGLLYTCESVEKHFQHKLAETNPCIISCGVEFPRDFPWPSFSLPFPLLGSGAPTIQHLPLVVWHARPHTACRLAWQWEIICFLTAMIVPSQPHVYPLVATSTASFESGSFHQLPSHLHHPHVSRTALYNLHAQTHVSASRVWSHGASGG